MSYNSFFNVILSLTSSVQRAKIIIVLERTFSRKQLMGFQQEYSVVLAGGGKDGADARGLMVIKTSAKTKARQRKGAITNWKVIWDEVVFAIKFNFFIVIIQS